MKALVYVAEKQLEVRDVPEPQGEFLVRVLGCAICGTDLKTLLHGHPSFKPPTILGHEFYGVVDKAPAGCGYAPGDCVVVAPYGECGVCDECRQGNGESCKNKEYVGDGAFCEKVSVPLSFVKRGVFPIPRPDRAFALVEPLACVLDGVEQMEVTERDKALVIGGGPMGALIAFTLKDRGIDVQVAELNELRRDCLNGWGIPAAPLEQYNMKEFTRIFVAVNKKELVEQAIHSVHNGGRVHVFAGLPSGTVLNVDAHDLHYRKVAVMGSSGFRLDHFRMAYEAVRNNPDHYRRLITHTFPLEKGQEAFDFLKDGRAFKIVIEP